MKKKTRSVGDAYRTCDLPGVRNSPGYSSRSDTFARRRRRQRPPRLTPRRRRRSTRGIETSILFLLLQLLLLGARPADDRGHCCFPRWRLRARISRTIDPSLLASVFFFFRYFSLLEGETSSSSSGGLLRFIARSSRLSSRIPRGRGFFSPNE